MGFEVKRFFEMVLNLHHLLNTSKLVVVFDSFEYIINRSNNTWSVRTINRSNSTHSRLYDNPEKIIENSKENAAPKMMMHSRIIWLNLSTSQCCQTRDQNDLKMTHVLRKHSQKSDERLRKCLMRSSGLWRARKHQPPSIHYSLGGLKFNNILDVSSPTTIHPTHKKERTLK